MYLLANENGDWLEIDKQSKFYLLDTNSPNFKKYLENEDLLLGDWLMGDKLEQDIEEHGQTLAVTNLESGRVEIERLTAI